MGLSFNIWIEFCEPLRKWDELMSTGNRTGVVVVLGVIGFLSGARFVDHIMLKGVNDVVKASEQGTIAESDRSQFESELQNLIAKSHGQEVATRAVGKPELVRDMHHTLMVEYRKRQQDMGFRLRFRKDWDIYGTGTVIGAIVGCLIGLGIASLSSKWVNAT